jgi:hypothetical protein
MPTFWILGFIFYTFLAFDFGAIPSILPVSAPKPLATQYIEQVYTSVTPDAGIHVPAILKELARGAECLDHTKQMKGISFGGATLDAETGKIPRSVSRVVSIIGSIDVGKYGITAPEPDECMY